MNWLTFPSSKNLDEKKKKSYNIVTKFKNERKIFAMNTPKITKRVSFETIIAVLDAAAEQGFGLPEGITFGSLKDTMAHEIELLDKKVEASAKRAAAKREAGDALREKILGLLTDEFQPISAIVAALGDPGVTPQMVTPRLTQLVELGMAEKEVQSVPGVDGGKSRRISVYRAV